ncbi:MAG: LptF/LptG family permease [Candidatus Eisenbacteria bacterium]|nr:LptF/LptG family permease [Candidatus Latescibacterota bacterium]MBD3302366.1 LptF/LptG family permease [Candidatus Eisenbacteria bacterium]
MAHHCVGCWVRAPPETLSGGIYSGLCCRVPGAWRRSTSQLHTEVWVTSRRLVPWGILPRYLARQLFRPFLIGFCVVTFLLSLDFLLDYLDLFLGKGIPFPTVARLFVLGLGWMVALSVPCGVLVAILMSFGQMSQDNEITALRASGVNPFHTMLPALFLSVLAAVGLTLFNNYALPETNYAFANLVAQIHRIRPTAQIQEGVFVDDYAGYDLFIRRLDDRTGEMRGILIIDASENRKSPRTILARSGRLRYLSGQNAISMRLVDGEIHEADPGAADGRYRILEFEEQTMVLEGSGNALDRAIHRSRGQREMSVSDMKAKITALEDELRDFQAQVDSSLASLGVQDPAEIPSLAAERDRPSGLRGLVAWVRGLFGSDPEPTPEPAEVDFDRRRKIEELRVRLVQTESVTKRIDQYRVEIQKKFSIPFACIVFVLVGAPLGMKARRGGVTIGFLSVAFFLFYYLCLIGGEQLADRGHVAPWIAMWLPNLILGVAGAALTYRLGTSGFSIASRRKAKA